MSVRHVAGWLLIAIALAACTADAPGSSGATTPAAPATQPTAGGSPSVAASSSATSTLAPPASAAVPSSRGLPPEARLRVEGADPVAGQLGSSSDAAGGSDSPWLPGSPVTAAAGEPIRIELADGSAVADWSARLAPAGSTTGAGAAALADGGSDVAFPAPGAGLWTVEVTIRFAAGGSATYYWRLDVT